MATMARGMSAFLSLLPNTFFELLPFLSPMPEGRELPVASCQLRREVISGYALIRF